MIAATDTFVVLDADGHRHAVKPRRVLSGGRDVDPAYVMVGDDVRVAGDRLESTPAVQWGALVALGARDCVLADGFLMARAPFTQVTLNGTSVAAEGLKPPGVGVARRSRRESWVGTLDLWAPQAALESQPLRIVSLQVGGADRPYRAWDPIPVEVRGTPKAAAAVRIAGLCRYVKAREVKPGIYRATLLCLPGVDVGETRVLARLTRKGSAVTAVGDERLTLVPTPPAVTECWPPAGSAVPPEDLAVYCRLASRASYPDAASLHLSIDGRDVTRAASVTPQVVYWVSPGPLAVGPHRARLAGRDAAGNKLLLDWTFTVGRPASLPPKADGVSSRGLMEPPTHVWYNLYKRSAFSGQRSAFAEAGRPQRTNPKEPPAWS